MGVENLACQYTGLGVPLVDFQVNGDQNSHFTL